MSGKTAALKSEESGDWTHDFHPTKPDMYLIGLIFPLSFYYCCSVMSQYPSTSNEQIPECCGPFLLNPFHPFHWLSRLTNCCILKHPCICIIEIPLPWWLRQLTSNDHLSSRSMHAMLDPWTWSLSKSIQSCPNIITRSCFATAKTGRGWPMVS